MLKQSYTLSDKAVQALNEMNERTKLKKSTIVEAGILEIYERFKENEKNNSNNGNNINSFRII